MSATEQQPEPTTVPAPVPTTVPVPTAAPTTAPTTTADTVSTPDAANTANSAETSATPVPSGTPATAEAVPATETKEPTAEPTPIAQLWTLAQANGHPEIWGVTLANPETHVPTRIVLQKYLNANDGDLVKAKDQLTKTLEWRAQTKPLDLVKKAFSKTKFDGLGYVTKYVQEGSADPEGKEVFTWNIYGGAKSIDDTFGNLEE
jgi:hypothetical protein